MNIRSFTVIAFIFVASFGAPISTSAAGLCGPMEIQDCNSVGKACDPGTGNCISTGGNPPAGPGNSNPPAGLGNPSAPPSSGPGTTLINPLQGGGNLESFLLGILAFVIRIGTIAVILMLVFVGYKFVVARGEPGKISEARSALLWTVVGALILLGSQAIAMAIKATVQAVSAGS